MNTSLIVLSTLLLATGAETEIHLKRSLATLIEEAEVPAKEAGVLTEVTAPPGALVSKDSKLAQIDDEAVKMQRTVAGMEFRAAKIEAENDVNKRFASKSAEVAEYEYREAQEANRRVANTFTQVQLKRLELTWQRSALQIEQADFDRTLAGVTKDIRKAQYLAADLSLRRRQIKAPWDGVIVKVHKHVGEWMNPGDPVLRMVRMDRLRVEAFLSADQYSPHEIKGRPVEVLVPLTHGEVVSFRGTVDHISPIIEAGNDYRIWTEVDNRKRDGEWLLRPGQLTEMKIDLR